MKYIVCATYPNADTTLKTDDIDLALLTFIEAYQMNGANHVNVMDTETGEVYALFDRESGHLWQSDEISAYMIAAILNKMVDELPILGFFDQHFPVPKHCLTPIEECPPCEDTPREVIPSIFEVMSALCGQQIAELGLSPEEAFLFPPVIPSADESEIVS